MDSLTQPSATVKPVVEEVEVIEVVPLEDVVLVMVAWMVDKNVFDTTVALAVTTCKYGEVGIIWVLNISPSMDNAFTAW